MWLTVQVKAVSARVCKDYLNFSFKNPVCWNLKELAQWIQCQMVIQLSFYSANIDTNKRVIESTLQSLPFCRIFEKFKWHENAAE